ncbi:polyprenyl synthetase family protein [Streptomyces sp. VRA16 Mangrove soil]|uniref:polyprenyl synthetase family protein n=1 Tax=Streptomyces sp. VRA16 Mangrove soil TaxID=2817434 RepID=UPI001A9DEA7D|nr:polyprenyl synthetase family protein [Streptomyces sp. VRA16 Mangrove soil]MBO1329975.1 polyprenyl synthetase family protein [Streptomyces sp. VRA16 Mangrove soil]
MAAISYDSTGEGRDAEGGAAATVSRERPPTAGESDCLSRDIDLLYPARPSPALSADLTGLDDPDDGPAEFAPRLAERLHGALVRPVRHLVDAGGRRWRPRLMGAVIEALGHDSARYTALMAAFELMHTGSLLVDDVQDEARLRRGRPAGHLVYGQAVAINAGTAAYFAMDRALRRTLPANCPDLRAAVYELYLATLRATHAGQALDLQGHHAEMDAAVADGDPRQLLHVLRFTHRLKSGAAVAFLLRTGALVADATPDQCRALSALGEAVGTAYQITDDLADLEGVHVGGVETKRVAEDLHNAKVTFPLARAVGLLPRADAARLWDTVRAGSLDDAAVRDIVGQLESCGAPHHCRADADDLVRAAWAQVGALLPDTAAARTLREMCAATVHRTRVA